MWDILYFFLLSRSYNRIIAQLRHAVKGGKETTRTGELLYIRSSSSDKCYWTVARSANYVVCSFLCSGRVAWPSHGRKCDWTRLRQRCHESGDCSAWIPARHRLGTLSDIGEMGLASSVDLVECHWMNLWVTKTGSAYSSSRAFDKTYSTSNRNRRDWCPYNCGRGAYSLRLVAVQSRSFESS